MPTISPKLAESLTRYFENELVKKDKNIKSLRARSGHRTDDLQQRIRSLQKKIDSMNRSSNLDRPGMAGLIRLVSTKRRLLAVLEKD